MSATQATITVGTDGSSRAAMAVEWAADEAVRRRLPLAIVHVIEDSDNGIATTTAPGMRQSWLESGRHILDTAAKAVHERHPDLAVTTHLDRGAAAFQLRERSKHAATVVLGHRGLGGFSTLLLGSTGLRVAGYGSCPVVLVRGEHSSGHGEVVVGADLFEDDTAMLDYAFEAAASRKARLRVVSACPLSQLLVEAGRTAEADEVAGVRRTKLDELVQPWRARFPDVQVDTDIVRAHPVVALEEASRRADLVVVGANGHTAAQGIFLGSVSHGIIHHA